MPDMDIDFDDEGRQKVIDHVVDKYGKEQVAQIVTFAPWPPNHPSGMSAGCWITLCRK